MSLAITLIYAVAAALCLALLRRQFSWLMVIMFVFAAGLALEEIHWFLPMIFEGTDTWPARNITEWFALTLRGISTPTTLIELGLVAGGRLLILLMLIYAVYFGAKYWGAVVTYVTTMPAARLMLLLAWEACLLIAFVITSVNAPSLMALVAPVKLLGAIVCLVYMIYEARVATKPR